MSTGMALTNGAERQGQIGTTQAAVLVAAHGAARRSGHGGNGGSSAAGGCSGGGGGGATNGVCYSYGSGGAGGSGIVIIKPRRYKIMAHFAEISDDGTVLRVIVVSNDVITDEDGVEQEQRKDFCQNLLGGTWVNSSTTTLDCVCPVEGKYDSVNDVFCTHSHTLAGL